MIYKNSNAPVLLKKINLNVWSLKDEISHVIMSKIDTIEEKELIKSLVEDYSASKPPLRLIKNETDESQEEHGAVTSDEAEVTKPSTDSENQDTESDTSKEQIISQKILRLPESKIARSTTIMSEIYMEEMFFFSETPFIEGQSIVIQFCLPQKFIMNADIVFCQTYSASNRVIGKGKLPYRVCAKFTFLRNGEMTLLRRFLNSVEPELKELKKIDKKSESEENVTEEMFEDVEQN